MEPSVTNGEQQNSLALEGIRVIELSRILAASYCGQMLADLGAEVIKIEMPGTGDEARAFGPPFLNGESTYFLSLNRNKDSVTLNLRQERAKEVLRRLIAQADVFLHNAVPASIARLGFDYEAVRAINPRIIYCAISGFGLHGPDRDRPALDLAAQALSGLMSLTGDEATPPFRSGAAISDISAGMFAAFGIVAALFQRERTGQGQLVDTSLIEASLGLLPYQVGAFFATGRPPDRTGNAHPATAPYNAYPAADGWVIIAAVNDPLWERCCRALDLEHLLEDGRFATNSSRATHRAALDAAIAERLKTLTTQETVRRLTEAGVPTAEVRDLKAVFNDPQVCALGLRQETQHPVAGRIAIMPQPVHLSQSPFRVRKPPPLLGEHTERWLQAIGFSADEIEDLRATGAI